jgi:hypothetical protein
MGNGEWGVGKRKKLASLNSLLPTPHSPLPYCDPLRIPFLKTNAPLV